MDELVALPDPDIVHRHESAGVVGPALGHHGAWTNNERPLDVGQHTHAISAKAMVEGLIDNGLLVTLFKSAAPRLVAQSSSKVHQHIIVEPLRQLDCRGWFVGEMSHDRAVTPCCHDPILAYRCDSFADLQYIDLQYILGGGEVIEWTPAESLVAEGAYEVATDFQYYAPASADALLTMHDGLFTFLFPQDGHKPLVSDGKNKEVHKVVVKIHRSMLSL